MVHLVYCDDKEKVLDKILSGTKTMIVRGAAGRKIPHSRVSCGEILYFMKKGSKKIAAKAVVSHVENYVKLTDTEIVDTLERNQSKLNLTNKQKERWQKKCLILVEFTTIEEITPALDFDHQGNMDDWLMIEKIEDVVVGTSIPYNYDNSKFNKKQMKFKNVRLLVKDFAKCFKFYTEQLGLEIAWGDENSGYASFKVSDEIEGLAIFVSDWMALSLGNQDKQLPLGFREKSLIAFSVDNVDETYVMLKAKGVIFINEPTDMPDWGMRTVHLRDPEENLIELYTPLTMEHWGKELREENKKY